MLTRSRDGCSASLASLTRETGPKVVKGDPARRGEAPATGAPPTPQAHHQHHHPAAPTIAVSDSSLKFTHVLYNLSPAGTRRVRMHGQLLLSLLAVLDCLSIINWNPKKKQSCTSRPSSTRRGRSSRPPARWRRCLVPRPGGLPGTSASSRTRSPRRTCGGASECLVVCSSSAHVSATLPTGVFLRR